MINYSVRGAITIKENTVEQIEISTCELLIEIIKRNDIKISDINQIIFSATNDITKYYPAVSARKLGIINASLLCVQEMHTEKSLPLCIRVSLNFNSKPGKKISHVYLGKAKELRPDLN